MIGLVGSILAGCGAPTDSPQSVRAGAVPRYAKIGKLSSPVLLKLPSGEAARATSGAASAAGVGASPARLEGASQEVTLLVGALQSVLDRRAGPFTMTTASVLDNATLAQQNSDPNYARQLAQWGRETGYFAAFELAEGGQEPGLLRASVLISRYRAVEGARAAYRYVMTQQANVANTRRYDLQTTAQGAPWDEAVLFYIEETAANGVAVGRYYLIFRVRHLIGFITNIGLAEAVSTRDTEELTAAVFGQLRRLL